MMFNSLSLRQVLADPNLASVYAISLSPEADREIRQISLEKKLRIFTLDYRQTDSFAGWWHINSVVLGYVEMYDQDASGNGFIEYMDLDFDSTQLVGTNGAVIMLLGIQRVYEIDHIWIEEINAVFSEDVISRRKGTNLPRYMFFTLEENVPIDPGLQALFDKLKITMIS